MPHYIVNITIDLHFNIVVDQLDPVTSVIKTNGLIVPILIQAEQIIK